MSRCSRGRVLHGALHPCEESRITVASHIAERRRETEIKHGRVAMFATLGWCLRKLDDSA